MPVLLIQNETAQLVNLTQTLFVRLRHLPLSKEIDLKIIAQSYFDISSQAWSKLFT
jgi:hypothetical protein